MTLMLSTPLTGLRILNIRPAMWTDWPVIASLIGLDVAARILPHAPDFTPVAATALFAACVLRFRLLSILVPIAAMLIGDAVLGFYDLKVLTVVYGALTLPACAACLSSSLRRPSGKLKIFRSPRAKRRCSIFWPRAISTRKSQTSCP